MKVRKALFMFVDLFGVDRFDYDTLVRGATACNMLHTANTACCWGYNEMVNDIVALKQ